MGNIWQEQSELGYRILNRFGKEMYFMWIKQISYGSGGRAVMP